MIPKWEWFLLLGSTRRALGSAIVVKHAVDGLAAQAEVSARLPKLLSLTQR